LAPLPKAGTAGHPHDLLLKVTPPRMPRGLLSRARLLPGANPWRDSAAYVVQAPAGFGKTSLLAQWRREYLTAGAIVGWLSADALDDPRRLVHGLALAVRMAAARPAFGRGLLEADAPEGLDGMTALLAELVQMALNAVVIIDEVDRLPQASREALAYLLRNAPANLRVLVAARSDCHLGLDDLVAYGQCAEIGPELLRFNLEETLQLVHDRFGSRVDRDTAARLYQLTEGWPLGLQLALTIVARGADAKAEVAGIAALGDALHDQIFRLLLSNLEPSDREFLVCSSILDHLHPDLCRAVTGYQDAVERLARLSRDTPVIVAAEHGEWLRMHALARDALRQRFASLDAQRQASAHARAAEWLAAGGWLEQAARHALAAGDRQKAYDLAERSLYESLMMHGRQAAVLDWIAMLPADELDSRPRLLLAAAWTLAVSERHEEAARLVARILAHPQVDQALRCECALILGGAAVFADDPDRFVELHAPWAESPPLSDPVLLQVHANRSAYRALLVGEPAVARLRQWQVPRDELGGGAGYIARWSDLLVGLSHVWEGQVLLADRILRPVLASAETALGRRSRFSCMLAALLAAASWERDRPDDAAALLADRLDVLERSGLPEALLLGYRTMARMAVAEGAEHRALELLGALDAAGAARNLPRLRIAGLVEQVRMHARRYRAQTCGELCERIDALLRDPALPHGPLWRRDVQLLRELARCHATIAARDWEGALAPLARVSALAAGLHLGRLHIEVLGLQALALERCGQASQALIREAIDLARAYGLRRVFADAHPDLGLWVGMLDAEEIPLDTTLTPPVQPQVATAPRVSSELHGTVLTPKEREVLTLLARSLSNKEIGRALQVGETTVKWHVKNLFSKLDAGTRKQVVMRARILGLLEQES
jgi:LuxR family maltose regulon positive regulatory protein